MGYVLVLGTCLVSPHRSLRFARSYSEGTACGGLLERLALSGRHFHGRALVGEFDVHSSDPASLLLTTAHQTPTNTRICATRRQPIQWTNSGGVRHMLKRPEGDLMSRIPHASLPLAL